MTHGKPPGDRRVDNGPMPRHPAEAHFTRNGIPTGPVRPSAMRIRRRLVPVSGETGYQP